MGSMIDNHGEDDLESSSSIFVSDVCEGSHSFKIMNYSLAKSLEIGNCVSSDVFHVGGCSWRVNFYPNGFNVDVADYISVYLVLVSEATDKRAIFKLFLVDQSTGKKYNYFKQKHAIKIHGKNFAWGCDEFMERNVLETLGFLKDDSLQIGCSICVVQSQKTLKISSVVVPPSDITHNLLHLLETGEEADVKFDVGGEEFSAHKLILGARSSVFNAQFFGSLKDEGVIPIKVEEMEPSVFKVLLHFIYSDDLPNLDELNEMSSTSMYEHLLAAADRYDLDRLKLLCATHLSKKISHDNVIMLWELAERHHLPPLKSCLLEFVSSHDNLQAVMETSGFQQIKLSDSWLIADFLHRLLALKFL